MRLQSLLGAAIHVYTLVILVRAVFSWLPARHRENEFYRFLYAITEPVLRPIQRLLPPMGGVDFSPLLAVVLLQLLARLLGA